MDVVAQIALKNFRGDIIPPEREWGVYVPIEKIDEAQRMVYGFASVATQNGKALKDLQGEIVTLDAIRNALPGWMEWGGNIRVMHQPIAAGTTKMAQIIEGADKEKEGLYIGSYIGDDDAWQKVQTQILRGFSIGGEKTEKIGDTVTALNLYEVSLVDRPANQACKIDLFKAAGTGVNSAVGLSKGWVPGGGSEEQFDRREMTWAARVIAKFAGLNKGAVVPKPEDWGHDGFSAPAVVEPVNHGNPANVGATAAASPLPEILTQPSGAPVPSGEAWLADVPPRDQNRILLMAGKAHVFKRDGSHLGSFPGDAAGKAAAVAALKAYIAEDDAKKMVGKAAAKAKKIAKRDRRAFMKALMKAPSGEVASAIRAAMDARGLLKKEDSTKNVNDLPDSDFAYISEGGSKDSEGKTTPRSLRHLPIHDASHVRNAAARLNQTDIPAEAKAKAHKKIKARGKEFGVEISDPGEKVLEPVLAKDIVDTVAQLRALQAEIAAEGAEEGGDPKDAEQVQDVEEIIDDLREHVLGEAQSLDSLFPEGDDGSLFAN